MVLDENEIINQLKITNKLLAQLLIKDSASQTERVVVLKNCGLSNADIADLLKIQSNVVSATLSNVKKADSKKKAK